MFLWNRVTNNDSSNELRESEGEIENEMENIEEMSSRVFVVCVNDTPILYKKNLDDTLKKVEEIVNESQFKLTCELKNVFVEWDKERGNVKIFSKNNNCLLSYESLESVVRWFELGEE